MSEIVESLKGILEGPIDYKSQKFTEQLSYKLLIAGAIVSSLVGFFTQDLKNLLIVAVLFVVITLGIILPPYPGYNTQKFEWYSPQIGK